MAFSELEVERVEKLAAALVEQLRPPEHIRHEVDTSYRVQGQFEIRPYWQDRSRKIESPIAKATYVKATDTWRVFWQRADMKWHRYSEVDSLEAFFSTVKTDEYGCFFG